MTTVLIGCHFIVYGESRAWVVHDVKLCGHRVGGKGHLPWAYMVPIHQIMREIKQAFGTDNICLPKNANEYPTRTRRQEANMDTYDSEKVPIISSTGAPSVQRTNDLSEKVTDSGASSTQMHLHAPNYPAPRPPVNSYRTILNKIKEESRQISTAALANPPSIAHRSGSVHDTHEISGRADTSPEPQGPESGVLNAQNEPNSTSLQHTLPTTTPRRSPHAPAAPTVANRTPAS